MHECREPSHEAFVLGIVAATLLVTAHALANLLGGCSFCTQDELRNASPSKQLSIACLVFTWYWLFYLRSNSNLYLVYYQLHLATNVGIHNNITFRIILAIGLSMLVIGIISNHKAQASCGIGHHRFLWTGGILCMVHALFSLAYYLTSTSALLWAADSFHSTPSI